MKKLISMLLALVMCAGSFITAFAAETTTHSDEARAVLDYVNAEREAAGLSALKWESTLVSFANTRAKEIMTKWSHTRPNGQQATDYPGVNGENLAYGADYTAADVVEGWMNSPTHRDNILEPAYTHMAVACIEAIEEVEGYGEVSIYYWVQLFHVESSSSTGGGDESSSSGSNGGGSSTGGTSSSSSSSSRSSSSSSRSSGGSSTSSGSSTTNTTTYYVKSDNVNSDGGVNENKLLQEAQNGITIKSYSLSMTNAYSIKTMTLNAVAKVHNDFTLNADTTLPNSKTIQGRMYIKPSDVTLTGDSLLVGVWTELSKTVSTKTNFEKWFNNKVAVVQLDQQGALGANTHIAVKVDLSELNTDALVFYTYDKANNSYNKIATPNYSIDSAGYLHFYTQNGGYIIITDKELVRK